MNIKLFRLSTGEDIITNVVDENADKVELDHPMVIITQMDVKSRAQLLIIDNWIPKTVAKQQMVTIKQKDVIFVTDPSPEFEKYYVNSLIAISKAEQKVEEAISKGYKDIAPEYASFMEEVDLTDKTIH